MGWTAEQISQSEGKSVVFTFILHTTNNKIIYYIYMIQAIMTTHSLIWTALKISLGNN